jgi:hypothetical protein
MALAMKKEHRIALNYSQIQCDTALQTLNQFKKLVQPSQNNTGIS